MGKIIAIMSGKGGVGKTTLTAYIGAALNRRGHRVLITDADFGMRDLDLVLGKENDIFFDAIDIWKEHCNKDNAIVPLRDGFDFLPATQSRRWEDVGRKGYGKLIKRIAKGYDYVIIDAPAGIGRGNEAIFRVAEQLLLVAEPMWVSLRAVQRVMQLCHEERLFNYGLVLNNVGRSDAAVSVDEALQNLQVENLATILPHSANILAWSQAGVLHEECDEAMDVMMDPLVAYIENDTAWEEADVLAHWQSLASDVVDTTTAAEVSNKGTVKVTENATENATEKAIELVTEAASVADETNNKTAVVEPIAAISHVTADDNLDTAKEPAVDTQVIDNQVIDDKNLDTQPMESAVVEQEQIEEAPKKMSFGSLLKRRFTSFWTRGGRLR